MCKWGTEKEVRVKIPADLSHTSKAYWRKVKIDACIAPLVEALNKSGIYTRGSCCGHDKDRGFILLEDGRTLIIIPAPTLETATMREIEFNQKIRIPIVPT